MSENENAPIPNAGEVIERFGGIRPMAKKIEVAVTTIQGWKKRDVIPAARYQEIMTAAVQHNVDLSDLIAGAPAVNENMISASSTDDMGVLQGKGHQLSDKKPEAGLPREEVPITLTQKAEDVPRVSPKSQMPEDGERPALKHRMTPAVWLHLTLAFIVILALGALLFPQKTSVHQDEPVVPIETEKPESSFLGPLIPKNLDEQIEALKQTAVEAQETMGKVAEKAQEISDDVLSENAGTFEQRYAKLEGHMSELAQTPELQDMITRVQAWSTQAAGQDRLDMASAELAALVNALSDQLGEDGVFESALQTVRENNLAVNQTFEGVPEEDLKAAALLLGMSQFRTSLGRDNKPFDDDLQVLMGLIGDDSPELKASLERLAPYAKDGVLTPEGLSTELKDVTGDAVVASLKGEDVSISERAKAKLNEVFQMKKDGELVTGTATQARMDKAQQLMDAGDIEGAIAQVQSIDGPAAQVTEPWIQKAQISLMAQRAKQTLAQVTSSLGSAGAGSLLIQNEETGINILQKDPLTSVHGPQPADANPYD